MKVDPAPAAEKSHLFQRALVIHRTETGQSLGGWVLVAALNLSAQIVFRRELNPGEFGSLNTALAAIGLMTVPAAAMQLAFRHYLARNHPADQAARLDSLRAGALLATETFGWLWGGISLVLVFLLSPQLALPRSSLQLFTLMNVAVAIGGVISGAVCEQGHRLRLWAWLLAGAALVRVLAGAGLASQQPWAESGLAAFFIAGIMTLIPALQARETDPAARWAACRAMWDRDFLLCLAATGSLLLALFLFSSADRILAQTWLSTAPGMISVVDFDAYQNAGLIARSLLWGTQPLLWIVFAERSRLTRTTTASLHFFWVYLAALFLGVAFLFLAALPISSLFCGDVAIAARRVGPADILTAHFVPSLAATMLPLGLLQGFGVFSLASRRYPECFVLGASSVGYTLILFFFGRQPELMPAYMFGAGLVSLMMLLFVGVVRWGRRQP